MSTWRRRALEAVPKARAVIERSEGPMCLWIELLSLFEKMVAAGEKEEIRKVLNYGARCISPRSGKLPNKTATAAVCAFYEDIGAAREIWPHFHEWFFPEEFENLKQCLGYHLSNEEFQEMENMYYTSVKGKTRSSNRRKKNIDGGWVLLIKGRSD